MPENLSYTKRPRVIAVSSLVLSQCGLSSAGLDVDFLFVQQRLFGFGQADAQDTILVHGVYLGRIYLTRQMYDSTEETKMTFLSVMSFVVRSFLVFLLAGEAHIVRGRCQNDIVQVHPAKLRY